MTAQASDRRTELLALAAQMFAERGLRATTVRDIADAAGILSGSLYHHFDSKESMVDEILREFLDELFAAYRGIVAQKLGPRPTLEALVVESFRAIDRRRDAVAIYQDEARRLAENERFGYIDARLVEFRKMWIDTLTAGVADGSFRADLDVEHTYRFLRDTVWIAVRWYRPGGPRSADEVAGEYLNIVLDGIKGKRRKP